MAKTRTQVAIIGAGPAGLLLGQLLHNVGIDSIILEARDRVYVENRIRAGVIEHGSAQTLIEAGVGARMQREGLIHHGIELLFQGQRHRIDFQALTGKYVTVYGQHEIVKDMIAARLATSRPLHFEVENVLLLDIESDAPRVIYRKDGVEHEITCDFIAGCDGFHGISRDAFPKGAITGYEKTYPFAWLGILAEAPPAGEELVYAQHERGFALFSMRSPTITRLYLQVEPDEDPANWPDDRIWEELHRRLETRDGWRLNEGKIIQKGVTAMRSFVAEPMRHGRLLLAGDAAHIVPPTGAKGMNLAIADVRRLSQALQAFYGRASQQGIDEYSPQCLKRIWKAQQFSGWMTSLLHCFQEDSMFERKRQSALLDYVVNSRAAATGLAENYVGLPYEETLSE
ncbi:4-hydroxybenzoate 3-monooxygenase [Lacibacterium aquatile]|uniref:4-hydroxybenzoate 3-monooxygenase n=1 Tax=Lacibacterium aquatile TaxID=1168082 RepID=A0ABW5DLR2_9PROT